MMKSAEIQAVVQFCQIGMKILTGRLLSTMGMLICGGLFAWVLYAPDLIRLGGACAFALLVYWPSVRYEQQQKVEGGIE